MTRNTSAPSKKSKKSTKKRTKPKKGKPKLKKKDNGSKRKQRATKKKPQKAQKTVNPVQINNFFLEKGIIMNTTNPAGASINPDQVPQPATPSESADAINKRQENEIAEMALCLTEIAQEQAHSQRASRVLIEKVRELTEKLDFHLNYSQEKRSREAEEKVATTQALEKLKGVLQKNKERREKINEKLNVSPSSATPSTEKT